MTGATYRRRDGLSVTRVEDDYFVVNPRTRGIFHLNALGRALWDALAEPADAATLTEALSAAFPEEPRARIAADTAAFLDQLVKARLVEIINPQD